LVVLLCLLPLLVSCGGAIQLSYDNADWLLLRAASQYVDLTADQSRGVKVRLARFHSWHRSEELPSYAVLFDEAARRLERGLSRQDVEWVVEELNQRLRTLGRHAGYELGPVMGGLSAAQIDGLARKLDNDNAKFVRTRLASGHDDLARGRTDWIAERIEDFTGGLTREQRSRLFELAAAFPEFPRLRFEERQRRQEQFLQLVRLHPPADVLSEQLADFFADWDRYRSEAYRRMRAEYEQRFVGVMVELDRGLTPRQRTNAVARLRDYARQFRELAGLRGS
jgi:hypothetical protein